MSLLERCRQFAEDHGGCAEIDLFALRDFVHSEVGRAASEKLDDAAPLVLYLATDEARSELLAAIREAMPGMVARKWP